MKRDQFIKTLATLAGGLTVVGCNPSLIDEMVAPDGTPDDLSIDEAENWFNGEYLSRFSSFQNERRGITHRRNATWRKAQKPKNTRNIDFGWVWVPLAYEGQARPAVILYDENTLYRRELAKYFLQPIIEGIVVVKSGGVNKAFLAQIAYDPFELAANGYKLEKSTFTGTLLRADWDDNLIDGTVFEKGEMIQGFTNPANPAANPAIPASENARTGNCRFSRVEYTTSYVDTDGVFTLVGHTAWMVQCDISGNGGWEGGGGQRWGYGGGGGGGTVPQMDSNGTYYDPLVHSGEGYLGGAYPPSSLYNFNIGRAVAVAGTDRLHLNANLYKGVYAAGLALSISSWSFDKATALARCIGGNVNTFFPLAAAVGKRIGVAGVAVSGYQLYLGISENSWQWDEDGWNAAQVLLGGTAFVAATVFAAPWVAVAIGGVSIGIAVYSHP